jgi:hypothetical protein
LNIIFFRWWVFGPVQTFFEIAIILSVRATAMDIPTLVLHVCLARQGSELGASKMHPFHSHNTLIHTVTVCVAV